MSEPAFIDQMAERLDEAWRTRTPIAPLSESEHLSDLVAAYAIQTAWARRRLDRGERIVGRKIGLTSDVIQNQLGVSEPDYGTLWESSFYKARHGRVSIGTSDFLQPRIEGEIAFLIGKTLAGTDITPEQVIDATEACALGVEIVDSRIADWRIKLADTIADNASYGGFTLGQWDAALPHRDLARLEMTIVHNGTLAAEGVGAAALGHPARSTAWLANTLFRFGITLEPGDIVISGGITKMLPIAKGDTVTFSLTGQPELNVDFT